MGGDNALNDGEPVNLPSARYPVSPGDSLSAAVSVSGDVWTFSLADATAGWTFSTPVTDAGSPLESSAEWAVGRSPVDTDGTGDLADFGTVSITDTVAATSALDVDGPIGQYNGNGFELLSLQSDTVVDAGISPPQDNGRDWQVVWEAAS
jgi:hypothetical protein